MPLKGKKRALGWLGMAWDDLRLNHISFYRHGADDPDDPDDRTTGRPDDLNAYRMKTRFDLFQLMPSYRPWAGDESDEGDEMA